MSRGLGIAVGLIGVCAGLTGVQAVWSQQTTTALTQCQSVLRVKQDLVTYSEQLAASLLVRAEKAEQELIVLRQQLEALQGGAPKEKE